MPDLLERLRAALADRYAVESEVGRGGMAVVFKAEDLRHDRKVAIKVMHPELSVTLAAERFLSSRQLPWARSDSFPARGTLRRMEAVSRSVFW